MIQPTYQALGHFELLLHYLPELGGCLLNVFYLSRCMYFFLFQYLLFTGGVDCAVKYVCMCMCMCACVYVHVCACV